MSQKSSAPAAKPPAEKVVRDIRRATRKHHSAEDKIRIVLEGLRGEESIAALCRREAIAESLYYAWSKEFLEAGKRRLAGDTARAATTDEVKELRQEARALKEVVAAVGVPVLGGVVSDGQTSIRRAVERALPGVPHQLRQFHFLREAAHPVFEADRHAKVALKAQLRGVRPIERTLEGRDDTAAEVARGYCAAVRSAITDDGRPPLAASGLKLKARLEAVADSLDRVAEKGGPRRRWRGSAR